MRSWLAIAAAASLCMPASAQLSVPSLKRLPKKLVRTAPQLATPPLRLGAPCEAGGASGEAGSTGIIGEKGRDGIIGEKGRDGVIGEKGRDGVIGEKGRDGVIGEKGRDGVIGEKGRDGVIGEKGRGGGELVFANRWDSDRVSTFRHVIEGAPGRANLRLDACSSASGGETVAAYLIDASGARKTGWRLFVIGTRNGNSRSGTLVLPRPARGQTRSKLPIMVVVENASGRPHRGHYQLTVLR